MVTVKNSLCALKKSYCRLEFQAFNSEAAIVIFILQVAVARRFHSFTPSLPFVRHLETGGGGVVGRAPLRKEKGCLSENLNLTPKGD